MNLRQEPLSENVTQEQTIYLDMIVVKAFIKRDVIETVAQHGSCCIE